MTTIREATELDRLRAECAMWKRLAEERRVKMEQLSVMYDALAEKAGEYIEANLAHDKAVGF